MSGVESKDICAEIQGVKVKSSAKEILQYRFLKNLVQYLYITISHLWLSLIPGESSTLLVTSQNTSKKFADNTETHRYPSLV